MSWGWRGYPDSYLQTIRDEQAKISMEIPQLEASINEGIIRFASDMHEYKGANLPSKSVAFAAVVLPHSFKNMDHKLRFYEHMDVMLTYEDCCFQGRCVYFGLPQCQWCEKRAPWFDPDYFIPYQVVNDLRHGWGFDEIGRAHV